MKYIAIAIVITWVILFANAVLSASTTLEMEVTAYCPCEKCCGTGSPGITASGHKIQPGDKFIAADKSIPFGTKINVPGYGIAPVLDRGGAIKGNKLDVFFPTHQEALEWGRKHLIVEIVK